MSTFERLKQLIEERAALSQEISSFQRNWTVRGEAFFVQVGARSSRDGRTLDGMYFRVVTEEGSPSVEDIWPEDFQVIAEFWAHLKNWESGEVGELMESSGV